MAAIANLRYIATVWGCGGMYKNLLGRRGSAIFFALAMSLCASRAHAQITVVPTTLNAPERWDSDNYEPPVQLLGGLATSDDLKREFDSIHYRMNICNETYSDVVVTVASIQGGAFDRAVAEVVRRAVIFSRERCPQSPPVINFVAIDHDGDREFVLSNLFLISGGQDFHFARIGQYYLSHWWGGVFLSIWHFILYTMLFGLLVWLAVKWEVLVRWYYLATPHPATDLVHSALAGEALDGRAFAERMRVVPAGRIEREVRAQQARALEALAREAEADLRRRADAAKKELEEEARIRAAQRQLHDATVDAQLAKTRADLLEKLADSLRKSAATP